MKARKEEQRKETNLLSATKGETHEGGAHMAKLMRVNMNTKEISVEDLSKNKGYGGFGGRGLTSMIVSKEVRQPHGHHKPAL